MDASTTPGFDRDRFRYLMAIRGWMCFPAALDQELLAPLRTELGAFYAEWRTLQIRNGVGAGTDGTLHHLAGRGGALDRFLASLPLDEPITDMLGGRYVLNACGAYLNLPGSSTYVGRIHRDVRGFTGPHALMVNMLVMLDDFTEENGASWMLSGSHRHPDRPSEDIFLAHAERNTGRAGDIVLFDSHLWHCAGVNRSKAPRRALTITYSRPFMKPQMDYLRLMGAEPGDEAMRQLLGLNARVPDSLDAYYQPPERRAYRADQG
ncbi:phytanoyl-CoA dioxygenase family protein [Roseomonas xinghualingensis]|uniref:phytanoyl-CoA dioxygenase family protein n=1 Tax=Roseomonas xinghualingensis TaxID=2986475 RepID=UPI0021F241B5|nr:phytanoyl-CoA dioxygenase family protein [Roseomonas sp. SXEYE001]MCV4207875.1 phytanoyl-CoA dioxygenase family protein [Roseomonas sp. SXEYE001]